MNWFEVLSIGIDLVTLNEISQVRQHAQNAEQIRLLESAHREIYQALRNLVFASKQSAEALEEYVDSEPQKVYIGANLLHWRLSNLGISQEVFDSFEDKKWVADTFKHLKKLLKKSTGLLDEEQLNNGDTCVRYILEMPLLNDSIEAEQENNRIRLIKEKVDLLKAELAETDDKWQVLKKQKNNKTVKGLVVAVLGSMIICGSSYCMMLGIGSNEVGTSLVFLGGGIFSAIVFFGGLVYAFFPTSKEFSELASQRRAIQQKFTGAPPLKTLPEQFSGMDLDELLSERDRRQDFILHILGEADEDFNYEVIFLEE